MPPNEWKSEAVWYRGNLDDWYNQSGLTVVNVLEKVVSLSPFLFMIATSWLSYIGLSYIAFCSMVGDCTRSMHGITSL